jgi:signal peptidase I
MSQKVRPEARNAEGAGARPRGGGAAHARPARGGYAREIIETIVLTAIVFLVIHAVAQPYKVDGPSMQPGLHTGDYVLISPILYAFGGSPQRGDVVVFHPPGDPGEAFVKRVIAVPGDTVSITTEAVTVNGKKLTEPFILQQGANVAENSNGCQNLRQTRVGPDEYLMMGDNRGDSEDSRCFGLVPRQNILGKATLFALPLNQIHWIDTYASVFAGAKH